MIGEADIFMNNMRTAALKKLGLDYETLHEEFPGLIWGQMRGYGEFGEFAHAPGYDAVCWAARGGVAVVEAKAFVGETLACEAVLMAQVVKNKNNK